MEVKLLHFNPDALELLLYTKETRLAGLARSLDAVHNWDQARKDSNLEYMLKTIKSSWEFSGYVFEINVVSRSFTHQIERHRVGTSFAEMSQRAVNVAEQEIVVPDGMTPEEMNKFCRFVEQTLVFYQNMVDNGTSLGAARQLVPQAVATNLIMGCNLRTLHDMAKIRLCVKTQGEFQNVFRQMKARVLEVHPWAEPMIQVHCAVEGTCAFPNLPTDACPVKAHVYNQYTARRYGDDGTEDALSSSFMIWPVDQIAAFWKERGTTEAPVKVDHR